MQKSEVKENKMGTMPVNKLLMNVSLPIVISMLVQALYNIVDSIFVSRVGEDALAAVSLVFPVQNLIIAVAVGTGVGINSLLSRRLGEKNVDSANRVAANGLFLAVVNWIVFVIVGLFFTGVYFAKYRANPDFGPDIADMGSSYFRIVSIGSLGVFGGITGERLLQASGRATLSMAAQLSGALTNIVLDPIFIFGLGPIPALGVTGAAIATIIGQWTAMVVSIVLNVRKNKEIKLNLRGFRPNPKTIKHIYQVGVPSIIMQSIGSVMVYGVNQILTAFGSTAVSLFGIYFRLQSFVFMPVFGFNNGLVSVIAFNYGAKQKQRIKQAIIIGLKICGGIMIFGTLLFNIFPQGLLAIFDAQENMLEIGVPALRIISLHFPIAAVCIVFSGVFQALGLGVYSMVMSFVRQLIVLLPFAALLSRAGLNYTWFAFPLAEAVSLIMALIFFKRAWKYRLDF